MPLVLINGWHFLFDFVTKNRYNSHVESIITDYKCPICSCELSSCKGGKLTNDGRTMYCVNLNCPCAEVMSHNDNDAKCYQTILDKYDRKPSK